MPTHPAPTSSRDGAAGFSLVELLVTLVVMLAVLATISQIVVRTNVVYAQQRDHYDRRYNTTASVEMIVRLLRQARVVTVDPDGNNQLDSIRIRSDWNPRDGDANDPYETITFTRAGTTIFKQEPADAAPVPFTDNVDALTFAYFNAAGGAITNPLTATQSQLAYVTVSATASAVDGQPGVVVRSSASIRRLE